MNGSETFTARSRPDQLPCRSQHRRSRASATNAGAHRRIGQASLLAAVDREGLGPPSDWPRATGRGLARHRDSPGTGPAPADRVTAMTWLITGGAGYIGAHVVRAMTEAGRAGRRARRPLHRDPPSGCRRGVPLVDGSALDRELLDRTLAEHGVTGVVHLAAKKQVGESVEQPLRYYRENVHGLAVLLEAVAAAGRRRFVFSSSAAVYGMPDVDLVTEDTPCVPMNPYGETKLAGEWLVRAAGRAHGIVDGLPALLQRRGRGDAGAGRHRRLQHRPDGLRPAHPRRGPADLRRRLPDPGRHLRPRLHPRRRTSPTPTSRRPAASAGAAAHGAAT